MTKNELQIELITNLTNFYDSTLNLKYETAA